MLLAAYAEVLAVWSKHPQLWDREASRDDLAAWRVLTSSTFNLRMLQGDHFFLQSNRVVILQALCGDLLRHL